MFVSRVETSSGEINGTASYPTLISKNCGADNEAGEMSIPAVARSIPARIV